MAGKKNQYFPQEAFALCLLPSSSMEGIPPLASRIPAHLGWLVCLVLLAPASGVGAKDAFRFRDHSTERPAKRGALTLQDPPSRANLLLETAATPAAASLKALAFGQHLVATTLPEYDVLQKAPVTSATSFEPSAMSAPGFPSMPLVEPPLLDDVTPVAEPCTWIAGALASLFVMVTGVRNGKSHVLLFWQERLRTLLAQVRRPASLAR